MKNKLNEKQEAETLFIRQWCFTIIDSIYSGNAFTEAVDYRKQAFSEETKIKYLERVKPEVYLCSLRQAFYDLNETAKNAPDHILKNLNDNLLSAFGQNLNNYSNDISDRVEKIKMRQEIIDDEEFGIIEQKVSELIQIDARSQQVITLNHLLSSYILKKK